MYVCRPEYEHRSVGNVRQKIELSPTKAASQRKQLSGVKLNFKKKSYRRLKTPKHSVSVGHSCSDFSFYEHFNEHFFTYTVFF